MILNYTLNIHTKISMISVKLSGVKYVTFRCHNNQFLRCVIQGFTNSTDLILFILFISILNKLIQK